MKPPQPKKRTRSIIVDLGRQAMVNAVGINARGEIEVWGPLGKLPIQSAKLQTTYERNRPDKPVKILNEADLTGLPAVHHIDLALRRFQLFAAIDTNTRLIRGEQVSLTAVVVGMRSRIIGRYGKLINLHVPVCYEFRDARLSPEEIGWQFAIRHFALQHLKGSKEAVALIVDHNLSDLASYNGRTKAIADGGNLPCEFRMIYASSDVTAEAGFANKMIRIADWHASNMLRAIEQMPDHRESLIPGGPDEPYTYKRAFHPTGKESHRADTPLGKLNFAKIMFPNHT